MGSTVELRKEFVRRLNQACDESPSVPDRGKGRQSHIANKMKVAPEAVSKWFNGVSMPRPDKMRSLAHLLDVEHSWLALGLEPELDRRARVIYVKRSDGAVHLVWGMISLAGGHCGEPVESDPRREYVDFYATIQGVVNPVHVTLAQAIDSDRFEVVIPKEYAEVRVIAVIPLGPTRYDFIFMSNDLIDKHKTRKAGNYLVTIRRQGRDGYATGRDQWRRIRSFEGPIN